jgi:hypothetical protein
MDGVGVKKTQPKDLKQIKKHEEWLKNYHSTALGSGDCDYLYSCVFRTLRDKNLYLPIETGQEFIVYLRKKISDDLTQNRLNAFVRKHSQEFLNDVYYTSSLKNYISIMFENNKTQIVKENLLLSSVKQNIIEGFCATQLEIELINDWLSSIIRKNTSVIKFLPADKLVPEDWNINDKNIYITNITTNSDESEAFKFYYFINKKKVLEEKKKDKAQIEKIITETINTFNKLKEQLNVKNLKQTKKDNLIKELEQLELKFQKLKKIFDINIIGISYYETNPNTDIFLQSLINKLKTSEIKNKGIIINEILKQIQIKHEQIKTNGIKLKQLKTKQTFISTKRFILSKKLNDNRSLPRMDNNLITFELNILEFEIEKLEIEISNVDKHIILYPERFQKILDQIIHINEQVIIFLHRERQSEREQKTETETKTKTKAEAKVKAKAKAEAEAKAKAKAKAEAKAEAEAKVIAEKLQSKKQYYNNFYKTFYNIQKLVNYINEKNNNIQSLDINKLKQKKNEILLDTFKIMFNDFKNVYKNRSNFIKTKIKELKIIDTKLNNYFKNSISEDDIKQMNELYEAMLKCSVNSFALQNFTDLNNIINFIGHDEKAFFTLLFSSLNDDE